MQALTAVIITGSLFVLFFVITILNFARMGKGMFSFDKSFEDTAKGFGNGFAFHAIFGGLVSLSFLALVASGIWLLAIKLG